MASNLLIEQVLQLDSGLLIPASAGVGKVLTSDASGNAAWAGGGAGIGGTATIAHTATASGSVVVTHGLGRTPTGVVAMMRSATLSGLSELYADTLTGTQFTLHDVYAASGTFSETYSWWAF